MFSAPDDTRAFLTDWRGRFTGRAQAVVLPSNTSEVASIVGACAELRVPIVPQGGNTGLAGGATPDTSGDAIVLSLKRMNQVREVDTINGTITVEAECTADVGKRLTSGPTIPLRSGEGTATSAAS